MKLLKAFHTWIRVVLPHERVAVFFFVLWFAFNAVFLYLDYLFGRLEANSPDQAIVGLNALFAFFYGLHRSRFHPMLSPKYREWLSFQPWTSRKPLPSGPIFLVWQDALIIVLLALPLVIVGQRIELIILSFLIPLALMWTLLSWYTQRDVVVYLVAFILPSVLLYISSTMSVLFVVAVSAIIAAWGVRRGFDRFPWEFRSLQPGFRRMWAEKLAVGLGAIEKNVGWSSRHLLDENQWIGISHFHSAMIALLAAWWALIACFLISWNTKSFEFDPMIATAGLGIGPSVAIIRAARYLSGAGSPISFFGRIVTLRWIIPGYDYVLLVPFAIAVCGCLGHIILKTVFGIPMEYAVPLSFGLCVWAALALPPTRRDWYLTGHYRLTPFRRNPQLFKPL